MGEAYLGAALLTIDIFDTKYLYNPFYLLLCGPYDGGQSGWASGVTGNFLEQARERIPK
jgi:hypothetical protein